MGAVPNTAHTGTPTQVVRVSPLALCAVALLLVCILFPTLGWPNLFGWMPLVPAWLAYWILRARTTVSEEGLRTRTLWGSGFTAWRDIKGVRFPRYGSARAVLTTGAEAVLPTVTLEDAPVLARFSGGRMPNPYDRAAPSTPAADATPPADPARTT